MPTATKTTTAPRRTLRFNTPDDLVHELGQLEASQRAGTLKASGSWTPGQNLGHLATWVEYTFDGTPMKPPWIIRFIMKFRKHSFLNSPMRAGVKIPGVKGGTLGTEPVGFDEGLLRLRKGWERLRREAPTKPNVLLGPLTHEEWIKLHLRHAELHLGFLHLR